jgi:hypothetical protein
MVKRWSGLVLAFGLAAACSKDKDGGPGGGAGGGYVRAGKVTEARLMLSKLEKTLKVAAAMDNKLPEGTAPLTPSKACCSFPDQVCPPDLAAWQGGLWAALEFQIDQPHRFQYDMTSDGTAFTARAVGDLNCKGDNVTLTLRGKFDATTAEVTTELDDPSEKR